MMWWVCSVMFSSPSDKRGISALPSSSSWTHTFMPSEFNITDPNWYGLTDPPATRLLGEKWSYLPFLGSHPPGHLEKWKEIVGLKFKVHSRKQRRQPNRTLIKKKTCLHQQHTTSTGAIIHVHLPRSAMIPPFTGVFSLSFFRLTTRDTSECCSLEEMC